MVLGANGPIGSEIVSVLRANGVEHVSVSRTGASAQSVIANRTDTDRILELIRARRIDTIVDVIAYTEPETGALLDAVDGHISRYVMLSSADVYRNYGLFTGKEIGDPDPILTEGSALRRSRYPYRENRLRSRDDPNLWMDKYDKIPIESRVKKMHAAWTILRLPMVFGARGKLNRFDWIMSPIRRRKQHLTVSQCTLNWVTSYGYVRNIAAAIVLAACHENAANRVFNVTDSAPVPHSDWIECIAEIAGWSGDVIPEPTEKQTRPNQPNWSIPLAMSGSAFKEALGFSPPYSRKDALTDIWIELSSAS